ncbi:histone acetyltransferase KAT7-like [Paramacrobiotus metropolitanus]|uniref:histone acetyltransferase KAT7-like n=1 Tax=Paramacrobiotus metropolitanus TaxID=2943436 RepID=UPI0024464FEB|nr:histone acetyltransferase KAT7-like [Paramacrobiotus metropolitanus]
MTHRQQQMMDSTNTNHGFEVVCPGSVESSTSSTSFDFDYLASVHSAAPGTDTAGNVDPNADANRSVENCSVGTVMVTTPAEKIGRSHRDLDGLTDALTRFYTPLGPRRKRGRGEYLDLSLGRTCSGPSAKFPDLMPKHAALASTDGRSKTPVTTLPDPEFRTPRNLAISSEKDIESKFDDHDGLFDSSYKLRSNDRKRKFVVPDSIPKDLEDIFVSARIEAASSLQIVDESFTGHLPPCVRLGRHVIRTLCKSFYPEEFAKCECLYICEFCLTYMKTLDLLKTHYERCAWHCPPGKEIYKDAVEISLNHCQSTSVHDLIVYEIDGAKYTYYCQNLCRLSTLYLDTKVVVYDVEGFIFYVLCYRDELGDHIVGYFSKDKSFGKKCNNLSCFLILPPYQKNGFGRFLVGFSYLLSRVHNMPGTPERPLSTSGEKTYRAYWRSVLVEYLCEVQRNSDIVSLKMISEETGMWAQDIAGMLQELKCLRYNGRSRKWELRLHPETYIAFEEESASRSYQYLPVRSEKLQTTPFRQFLNIPPENL